MQSLATVSTANAARYLSQLCKHWSHRFAVAFDKTSGRIDLPLGVCLLTAGPGGAWRGAGSGRRVRSDPP